MIPIQINAENEIRVEMTIANQLAWGCTGTWNHLFPFLMKKFKPIKIAYIFSVCIYFFIQKIVNLLQIYIIFKMISVWKCNFVKVYTFLQGIRCLKNLKVDILRIESDLAIFNATENRSFMKTGFQFFSIFLFCFLFFKSILNAFFYGP